MSLEKGWSFLMFYDFVVCCNFSFVIYVVLLWSCIAWGLFAKCFMGFQQHADKFIPFKKN